MGKLASWVLSVGLLLITVAAAGPVAAQQELPKGVEPSVERYRTFLGGSESIGRLRNLTYHLEISDMEMNEEGARVEVAKIATDITILISPDPGAWMYREDTIFKGQELALVATASGEGFGILGSVPQNHPSYSRRATEAAAFWVTFWMRHLNPGHTAFEPSYESRVKRGPLTVESLLLTVKTIAGETSESWRLRFDVETGALLEIQTFDPQTYALQQTIRVGNWQVAAGVKFPETLELYDDKGVKTSLFRMTDLHANTEVDLERFKKPEGI